MQIRNAFGIDLGTSTVKIYNLKKDTITQEKNMIAIRNGDQLLAIGNQAYEMSERAPQNIEVITPMTNGRIANVFYVEAVLHTLIHRCCRRVGYAPDLYFSVPPDMTEMERRAYYSICHRGSLRHCRMHLVDKPIADALALGIPINKTKGSMIVNIGAQNTEISVISEGRVIFERLLPIGGKHFNESIANQMRRKNNLQIGLKTAKRLKMSLADLGGDRKEARVVRGIGISEGLPAQGLITSSLVNNALLDDISVIAGEIKQSLERTPPQVHANIEKEGIYLTGGSTRLPNLDTYLTAKLEVPVQLSQYYDLCTICGLKELITHKSLHHWAYPVKKRKPL